ncbi:MAG: exodeoxyribonuclease VII large subunit [Clostridia bacterium]|nr:exodeoxyribonuclease VII large subunit [Clostridia bacterium]
MSSILKVSQINTYLKSVFESDSNLRNIYVCGEISNFTNHYRSGHMYFTLKDESSAIKAVMFRSAAQRLRFEPENGMKVLVRCTVSVFERDGTYQLYCEDMQPEGIGELTVAFEQMKRKLESEGLFSVEHKKPLPLYPEKIGVVTSPTGAALQDIINVISRRYPSGQIILAPVKVQGVDAAREVSDAIDRFSELNACDVLIVGRGGGSIEDLWAFNEEIVARSVFNCKIPVISAVGHETDFTICDFVSDMRAPTPSAAAELAVPDYREVLYYADKTLDGMAAIVHQLIGDYEYRLLHQKQRLENNSPHKVLQLYSQCVDACSTSINAAMFKKIDTYSNVLSLYALSLEGASPLKTLSRGYAIVKDDMGATVKKAADLKQGSDIDIVFHDCTARCTVNEIIMDETTD